MKILSTSKNVNLNKAYIGIFMPCEDSNCDLTIDDNGNTEYYMLNGNPKTENKIILSRGEIKSFPGMEYLDSYSRVIN